MKTRKYRGRYKGELSNLRERNLMGSSPALLALARLRSVMLRSIRNFFETDNEEWVEITAPTLSTLVGACEDLSTVFSLKYFDRTARLIQTSQLHLEPFVRGGFTNAFSINHSYRAEPRVSLRHLTEFTLVEAEIANCDLMRMMRLEEDLIISTCRDVIRNAGNELRFFRGKEIENLIRVARLPHKSNKARFPHITYDEVIVALQKDGFSDLKWGDNLENKHEIALGRSYATPFFVIHYPKEIKFFNMKQHPHDPRKVLSCDLILPGVGEAAGGSERETIHSILKLNLSKFLRKSLRGEELTRAKRDFAWYLDMWRPGMPGKVSHSGFGLGFERLVKWVCAFENIVEGNEYPRNSRNLAP
jgi:asparaginyl-tRNA synthetase